MKTHCCEITAENGSFTT